MDELIFQFLLQAGYPRASIISDPTLLTAGAEGDDPAETATFAIVDPETAERLAVVDVVEAIDSAELEIVADQVGHYAELLGGRTIQGFLIRVDPHGMTEAEQVQFYRVWPNSRTQQLTAKTFPDLDALKVASLLARGNVATRSRGIVDFGGRGARPSQAGGTAAGGTAGRYVPAIVLALLAVTDVYVEQTRGTGLLNLAQALLAIGAAALLTLAAAYRAAD